LAFIDPPKNNIFFNVTIKHTTYTFFSMAQFQLVLVGAEEIEKEWDASIGAATQ
jgi:hypothetical protein